MYLLQVYKIFGFLTGFFLSSQIRQLQFLFLFLWEFLSKKIIFWSLGGNHSFLQ